MPTGYTADINDGITFQTFAMNCARAFGACVELRDEPAGGDRIPDAFQPSDYHLKALEKARASLSELEAMTPADLERMASNDYDEAETRRVMRLKEIGEQRAAYEAMLLKVNQWTPPTDEHQGLKDFMVEQITKSIDFDCSTSYHETPTVRVDGASWAAARRQSLQRDVAYHTRQHAEEVERAASRTKWVADLRKSLEPQ